MAGRPRPALFAPADNSGRPLRLSAPGQAVSADGT